VGGASGRGVATGYRGSDGVGRRRSQENRKGGREERKAKESLLVHRSDQRQLRSVWLPLLAREKDGE